MSTADLDQRSALVVDLGTTGAKVAVATLAGRVLWSAHHEVATTLLPGGGAEQDAESWWQLLRRAWKEGLASDAVDPATVEAVGITGQWSSTVPVDAAGTPVGPCLLWMDRRGKPYAKRNVGGPIAGYHPRKIATWVRHTGGAPSLDGTDPLGHRWFLAAEQPEVHQAARWLLEPIDYLAMRLTGVASATPASMTGAWLTDNREPDRAEYDQVLVGLAGIDPDKLPPLRPTLSPVGEVRAKVAADLGLPDGVQVISGLPDVHNAALGSGAVAEGAAHLAISTTSWISLHIDKKKTDITHQIASVPGVLPGRYIVVDNQETAGRCFQWARDALSEPAHPLSYDELGDLAATADPGAGGVLFTPWLAGERSPVADGSARGGFHRLGLDTTRADLARSVMEGVAANSRWLHRAVERFAKTRLDDVRAIGGGASSALWLQIHADVLDRTVHQVADPLYAGLRGAAVGCALALGRVEPDEVADLVPVAETFHPDPANRATYDRLAAVLPDLHKADRRLRARLRKHRR